MKSKKNIKIEDEQLKISKDNHIDINFIEILVGDRKGTASEHKRLKAIQDQHGDEIFIEIIYFLTHTYLKSRKHAKFLFNEILKHRINLNKKLKRNIGIQVAILDYSMNIHKTLINPTIIEEDKITEMATNAITDKMTQAYDKKFLFHDLEKEIEKTKRYGTKFSLLMVDLDNLKKINDKFGHIAGDEVLKALCEILIKNIRKSDNLYRFGGDEFLILIPESTKKTAQILANNLLNQVNYITVKKYDLKFSVSIGIASFNKGNIKNMGDIIDVADKALYYAKKTGKNKLSQSPINQSLKVENNALKKQEVFLLLNQSIKQKRFEINGKVISHGYAKGKAFIYDDILSKKMIYKDLDKNQVIEELLRIKKAIKQVTENITKMRNRVSKVLGKKYADIFDAHLLLLNDPQIIIDLETELINERINAEHIVKNVFKRIENRFKISDNKIIRERADDIIDLARRLLHALAGVGKNILSKVPPNSIVIASNLYPSDTINLKRNNVNAIITETGSITSHAGLLAKSLNIPFITSIDCPKEMIKPRMNIIVASDISKIIVNPSHIEIQKYNELIRNNKTEEILNNNNAKDIKLKYNNNKINILANVNSRADIDNAIKHQSDGIGLYRIEQIYMKRTLPPDETELFNELNESFKHFSKEITLRLLDIGGDKILPYITKVDEIDSFLGLRGVRVLLKNPRILETQLKVFLQLSQKHNIKVLIPMVTIPEEIIAIRNILDRIKKQYEDTGKKYKIELGSMIETPSAVIKIKEILELSDFVSIGTNDLIQYTMASGRVNIDVDRYYEAGSEIVMDSIKKVLKEAKKTKKECILCGELASDIRYLKILLKMGLKNFSVASSSIPKVKIKMADIINPEL